MNTPVYLTDEEARLFTQFMKHRELVDRISKLGLFTMTDTRVEILLDSYGRIGDVFVHTRHKNVASV